MHYNKLFTWYSISYILSLNSSVLGIWCHLLCICVMTDESPCIHDHLTKLHMVERDKGIVHFSKNSGNHHPRFTMSCCCWIIIPFPRHICLPVYLLIHSLFTKDPHCFRLSRFSLLFLLTLHVVDTLGKMLHCLHQGRDLVPALP